MTFKILILIFTASFSFSSCYSKDEFSKGQFKVTPLNKTIFILEGAGGNVTASIGAEGVLLVDDDFKEMSKKLLSKLKKLGGKSPRFIINTHFHYDHTGGNENFGASATIIAAESVRERLMSNQTLWRKIHPAFPTSALPILTFDKSLTIHMNDDQIRIVHLPHGHTDGDTVVFFEKNKIISMGDLYFSNMYPIFHQEHDGSLDGFIKNIEFVLNNASADTQIVPGHGPLSSRLELQKYYEMIVDSIATVKNGIQKGQTLEQIQKIGLPSKWESFSHGYLTTDKWIALLYKSLSNSEAK